MAIGRRPEQIIADRRQQLARPRVVSAWEEDTLTLGGRVVWGKRDQPPPRWHENHNEALHITGGFGTSSSPRGKARLRRLRLANLPVPRHASCHYYRQDADPKNFYFY